MASQTRKIKIHCMGCYLVAPTYSVLNLMAILQYHKFPGDNAQILDKRNITFHSLTVRFDLRFYIFCKAVINP